MEITKFVNRYWRFILFFAATFGVLVVLYAWRGVLLPFMLGLVMANLFMPPIRIVERLLPGRNKNGARNRIIAIGVVMFAIMVVFAAGAFIVITYIIHSGPQMMAQVGNHLSDLVAKGKQLTSSIRNLFPDSMKGAVDGVVQSITNSLTGTLTTASTGSFSGGLVSSILGAILGFAAVPLFLFYLLKDSELCVNSVCTVLGESKKPHMRSILGVLEGVLGQYIRAQFFLSGVLFTLTLIGLLILRVPFALPLAFIYGLGEMVPTFGAWIATAILIFVVLALAPDKLILVLVMALGVHLLENIFLVPRVEAKFMRLHPVIVILLLVLGGHFWGLWGMILTVPLAATVLGLFNWVKSVDQDARQKLAEAAARPAPDTLIGT
jgi:predicted PurR-regulated permease PerM